MYARDEKKRSEREVWEIDFAFSIVLKFWSKEAKISLSGLACFELVYTNVGGRRKKHSYSILPSLASWLHTAVRTVSFFVNVSEFFNTKIRRD